MTKTIETPHCIIHKNIILTEVNGLILQLNHISHKLYAMYEDKCNFNLFILWTPENEIRLHECLQKSYIDLLSIDLSKPFKLMGYDVQFIYDVENMI